MKKVLIRLAFLAFSALLGVVVVELGLRVIMPGPFFSPLSDTERNDFNSYWLKNKISLRTHTYDFDVVVRTNGQRMRADRDYGPKPAGVYRIIFLGDSFTKGTGVNIEEVYTSVIERALKDSHAPAGAGDTGTWGHRVADPATVECLNFGVGGYNTFQYLHMLERHAINFEPDLVVIGLLPANDMAGSRYDSADEEKPAGAGLSQIKNYLYLHSYLYGWINVRVKSSENLRPLFISLGLMSKLERFRWTYKKEFNADEQKLWDESLKHLSQIAHIAGERGAKTMVLMFPTKDQMLDIYWTNALASLKLDPNDYDRELCFTRVSRYLDTIGVPSMSLYPALSNYARQNPRAELYFQYDMHWTALGQKLTGEAAAEWISANMGEKIKAVP